MTATWTYDVFGSVRAHSGAPTEWLFTGEQSDPTGFYYLRARYYDRAMGRFLSRDPFPGIPFHPCSLNRYVYVENNPANFVDPSGRRHYLPPTLHGEKTSEEDGDGDRPVTEEEVRTDVEAKSLKDCLWDCYFPDVGFLPGWLRGPVWEAIWASCGGACGFCGYSVGAVVPACEICAVCLAGVGLDAHCVYECVGR